MSTRTTRSSKGFRSSTTFTTFATLSTVTTSCTLGTVLADWLTIDTGSVSTPIFFFGATASLSINTKTSGSFDAISTP